ncbi:MAG TPA: alpha/beta fold hydrolase [Alphaproteobacteria bacterium]|jgi:pimeloyl-ACP methyl ester carboxylesterase|nr:alpha/beta fold hydrolase [Alphaproteobacteria bacterium]
MQEIMLGHGATALSGRFAPASRRAPRALIFAIHGGSYTSHYFGFESLAGGTLFDLAPRLGYAVLAIDRPGYGTAADRPLPDFDSQARLLAAAIREAAARFGGGSAGTFLVGHSIGAMLAMLIAAHEDAGPLLGLDLSGAGVVYRAESLAGLRGYVGLADPPRPPNREARRARMFGPPWTRSEAAVDEDFATAPLSQPHEIREALGWGERMPSVAGRIALPVNFVVGELDALWDSSPEAMARIRAVFTAAPRAEVRMQPDAGHCNHLHHAGRACNLRTLAFFDECLIARERAAAARA